MVRIQGDAELLRCLLRQAQPLLTQPHSAHQSSGIRSCSLIENDLHSREISSTLAINSQSR